MENRILLPTRYTRAKLSLLVLVVAAALASCSTTSPRVLPENETPPAPVGPLPEVPDAAEESADDASASARQTPLFDSVHLVIGGAGAAPERMVLGFAAAGVLKTLKQANVPISGIDATEMAAIVSGLYVNAKTLNDFEWGMQQLKPELFERDRNLLGRESPSSGEALEKKLTEVLGSKLLQGVSPKLTVLLEGDRGLEARADGVLVDALRCAIARPDAFRACRSSELPLQSRWSEWLRRVDAELSERELLVWVDLGGGNTPAETERVMVIRPRFSNVGAITSARKSEAIFLGARAMKSRMAEVLSKLGRATR